MSGFTLIELAVVIVIIGALLGALLVPLGTQIEVRLLRDEQRQQRDLRDALIGFAVVNRRLPCPDNDRNGLEDTIPPGNGPCSAGADGSPESGFLPYQTLGVPATDTWGRLYLYRVDADYVLESTPGTPAPNATGLDMEDTSNIRIRDRREADKSLLALVSDAAAVVVSTGPNGHGGTDMQGNSIPLPPSPPALEDEAENLNVDVEFISRVRTLSRDDCSDSSMSTNFLCEFDDVVIWVPSALLMLRLVEAQALP